MTAKLILLFSCILLQLAALTLSDPVRNTKLIRARREVALPGLYFVSTMNDVDSKQFSSKLQTMQKNGSFPPGFQMELHGFARLVAHGFFARLSNIAVTEIMKFSEVESIQEDQKLQGGNAVPPKAVPKQQNSSSSSSANSSSSSHTRLVLSWGLDRLDQDNTKYDYHYTTPCGLTGKGVDVYILDSGISYVHEDFEGRASSPGCDPIDQIFNTSRNGSDCTGHGTHVAGTVGGKTLGVASGVRLFSVRVLDCQNFGSINSLVLGAECVAKSVERRKRPAIVNLSIYGEKNLLVKRALDTLMRKGITVVSIAGNTKTKPKNSCKFGPGSIQGIITASASTRTDEPFMFSNAGTCVDLYAPGALIPSASRTCRTCKSTKKGSSMAAPHVTGAIALLLEKCPRMRPWRVKHVLLSQMTKENKLDFSRIPRIYRAMTPNLLLHTSSLKCDIEC